MRRLSILAAVSMLPLMAACTTTSMGPKGMAGPMLAAGVETTGTLQQGDRLLSDNSWYDPYAVQLTEGQRIRVTMTADGFDAYLLIGRGSGEAFESLKTDDDSGGGTNAQLDFTAPADGLYEIRADALAAETGGAYGLTLTDRGMAPPPPPPGSIAPGAQVDGSLAEGDAVDAQDQPYDAYLFHATRGQRFQAVMRSAAFDTLLEIGRAGGEFEALRSDDDGAGDGTNSRLNFTAPEDGDYVLRARRFSGSTDTGAYSLTFTDRGPAPAAPAPTALPLGQRVQGTLADTDPSDDEHGTYDAYVVHGTAGQRLSATLVSEGFDTIVRIGTASDDGGFKELVADDDGGPGSLDSRALLRVPADGDYIVRAEGFSGGMGDYTLDVVDLGPEAREQSIRVGETVAGTLAAGDGFADDHGLQDLYAFHADAGQRLTIALASQVFDTKLTLLKRGEDGTLTEVQSNDDSGGGTNSRINLRTEEGDYVIRAAGLAGIGEGAYTLALSDLGPEPKPVALRVGETVRGTLESGDGLADDATLYDGFVFHARRGERLQIVMRSGDFDTYLLLGRTAQDGTWESLGNDDDGLGDGTNSRIFFTAPADGDYEVRADALTTEGRGAYELVVEARAADPAPGSLVIGATVRGTLADGDARADDGSLFDAYRFQARRGEALRIGLATNAFDAFVVIGRIDGQGNFEALASDDDGGGDSNAQLDWTPPADGDYVLHANSFAPTGSGDYTLTVDRKP